LWTIGLGIQSISGITADLRSIMKNKAPAPAASPKPVAAAAAPAVGSVPVSANAFTFADLARVAQLPFDAEMVATVAGGATPASAKRPRRSVSDAIAYTDLCVISCPNDCAGMLFAGLQLGCMAAGRAQGEGCGCLR